MEKIEDEDDVGGEDRREAVRDRDLRPALHQRLEGVLDEPFAEIECVDRLGGLIQEYDGAAA